MKKTIVCLIFVLFLSGCANQVKNNMEEISVYKKITAEKAKKIIDTETEYTILDVRTEEEFSAEHIDNAILIPDYEISEKAKSMLPEKNRKILVYCRSGNRSATAAKKLLSLGYTDVLDFGGIVGWQYETVK